MKNETNISKAFTESQIKNSELLKENEQLREVLKEVRERWYKRNVLPLELLSKIELLIGKV